MHPGPNPFVCSKEPRRQQRLISGCAGLLARCRRRRRKDRRRPPAGGRILSGFAASRLRPRAGRKARTAVATTPQRSSAFGLARHSRTHRSAPGNAGVPPASARSTANPIAVENDAHTTPYLWVRGPSGPHLPPANTGTRPALGAQRRPHLRNILLTLAAVLLFTTITTTPTQATTGPQTTPVDLDAYTRILHVSTTTGDDATATGTPESPYASITAATTSTTTSATNRTAILIAAGTYNVHNLTLTPNTDLYGGFDPTTWTRDIQAHPTILDARNEGRVLLATAADTTSTTTPAANTNPRIDGLHIQNGRTPRPRRRHPHRRHIPRPHQQRLHPERHPHAPRLGPPSTSTRPPTTAAPSTAATAAPPRSATT